MVEPTLLEPAGASPFVGRMTAISPGEIKSTDCEVALKLGVFFDGTDNKFERDNGRFGDSNIARLWKSYPVRPAQGLSSLCVSGAGTPFDESGAAAVGWQGTAFVR